MWNIANFTPERAEIAAIEVQRVWRGYRVRSKVVKIFEELLNKLSSPSTTSLSSLSCAVVPQSIDGNEEAGKKPRASTARVKRFSVGSRSAVKEKAPRRASATNVVSGTAQRFRTFSVAAESSRKYSFIERPGREKTKRCAAKRSKQDEVEKQTEKVSEHEYQARSVDRVSKSEFKVRSQERSRKSECKVRSLDIVDVPENEDRSLERVGKQAEGFEGFSKQELKSTDFTGIGPEEWSRSIFKQGQWSRNTERVSGTGYPQSSEKELCCYYQIGSCREQTRKVSIPKRKISQEPAQDIYVWREESLDKEVPTKLVTMTKKTGARLALEAAYDRYVQHALKQGQTSTDMLQFTDYCAHRIQVWWLMKHRHFLRARFIQRLMDLQKKAALQSAAAMEAMIQESVAKSTQRKRREGPLTEREAAISIQRAWRRHILRTLRVTKAYIMQDIQVYRYYRDLINFKTRGDPAVMLRCINPTEAKLLDAASGTSVRFRLAGDRFPPNIYYKIFTHRPIQDMCANSPKDYTIPQAKQLNVRHRHNNVARLPPQQDDKAQWYKRAENNGWRLVSDRLIHHIMNDPITWESSKKTYHFDHSKLKRRQDVEKQKKSRKIEWMKKMYKQGMLRARADDHETIQLIEGAAAGMMATVDNHGPEALEDWEVDELLDWTTSLNFEEYFSTWKDLATSAAADHQIEKTLSLSTSKSDPYELTVSTAPSRFQSTRQSEHTPASGSIHIKT